MATVNELLTIVYGEVGYAEKPVNKTKYGKHYRVDGSQWCGIFVNWCAEKAHVRVPITFYTPAGAAGFKKEGRWHTTGEPLAGDVIYFDWKNDNLDRISHVGFVVKYLGVINGKRSVLTIEGNTTGSNGLKKPGLSERNGGEVAVKIRTLSEVVGWGRPRYKVAPTPLVDVIVSKYAPKPPTVKKPVNAK